MDIATLVKALGPAFAAGFALQRLLEILDPILDKIKNGEYKKIVLGLISFAAGLGLAAWAWPKIRVLSQLTAPDTVPAVLDYLVTALIISGGTEGFNSIIKFLSAKKEETKASATIKNLAASRALTHNSTALEGMMDFNSGNAMDIAYKSVTKTTGSSSPVDPGATLDKYNMQSSDTPSVKNKILSNTTFGLPHYQRTMDPSALNGLDPSWELQELADVILEQSGPDSNL